MSPSDKILYEAFEALNKALLPDTVPPEIIAAGVKAYRDNLGHLDRTVAMMWLAMWDAHQKMTPTVTSPRVMTQRSLVDRRSYQHAPAALIDGVYWFNREGVLSKTMDSRSYSDRRR